MAIPAVFLDRDGVLIHDCGPLTRSEDIELLSGVGSSLKILADAGYRLICVSNQTVVARGLLDEEGVEQLQHEVETRLRGAGAPALGGFYYCPHHPEATIAAYRDDCACRKPKPGLLEQAITDHDIDPAASFIVGDRLSDIAAGQCAGVRGILLCSGRHVDAPIISSAYPANIEADHQCSSWAGVVKWILTRAAAANSGASANDDNRAA